MMWYGFHVVLGNDDTGVRFSPRPLTAGKLSIRWSIGGYSLADETRLTLGKNNDPARPYWTTRGSRTPTKVSLMSKTG